MIAYQRRCDGRGLAYIGCVLAGWLTACVGAQTPDAPREIPWREDIGVGREADPGRSLRLPPVDASTNPTSQTASDQPAPDQWWKEDAEDTVMAADSNRDGRGVSPRGEIIQSTQILSWVGGEPILAGDLLGRINEMLAPYAGKAPEEELERQRWILMERMLPSAIESKLVFVDFVKRMETEQVEAIRDSVYEQFDERNLPKLMEQAKTNSPAELQQHLRQYGTSLNGLRRAFFEQVAAREVIRKSSDGDDEVTHDELLEHYRDHEDEFSQLAEARWQQLTARFDKHPSKAAAYAAIAKMGNAVLRGADFAVVAKRDSDGLTADDGGRYDWTTQGSLVSEVIDAQIFELEPNVLSRILEDRDGFHIVRVVERKDAGLTPFLEAQVKIREQIKSERRDAKVKEYLQKLKTGTYVWSYFEDPAHVADRARRLE